MSSERVPVEHELADRLLDGHAVREPKALRRLGEHRGGIVAQRAKAVPSARSVGVHGPVRTPRVAPRAQVRLQRGGAALGRIGARIGQQHVEGLLDLPRRHHHGLVHRLGDDRDGRTVDLDELLGPVGLLDQ